MCADSFEMTSVNDTSAPGTRPFNSRPLRTSNGIVIAGITFGTLSCEMTTLLCDASTERHHAAHRMPRRLRRRRLLCEARAAATVMTAADGKSEDDEISTAVESRHHCPAGPPDADLTEGGRASREETGGPGCAGRPRAR
jgi:hypothetical protein